MSRNLGRTTCKFCDSPVVLTGSPEPGWWSGLVPDRYREEYKNGHFAMAECPQCLAKYTAWLVAPPGYGGRVDSPDGTIHDLSFQSTFDDEADESDLPIFEVVRVYVRVGFHPKRRDPATNNPQGCA